MAGIEIEESALKVPPQALEVEQAVLGAMLLDGEAVAKAVESIEANYFYKKSHQLIFDTMAEMFEKEKEIDLYTLTEALKQKKRLDEVGGPYYLAEISNSIPTSAHIEQHLDVIKQKALSRVLIRDCEAIIGRAYEQNDEIDALLDFAEQRIFEISERRLKKGFAAINPILHQTFERIDKLYHSSRSGVTGVPTGYKRLNELTAGLQPSELVILAGRPSMGKTAFALNIARNAAIDYGIAVGIFSLEMSSEALVLRLLCTEAKVNQMAVRTGKLTKDEMSRLTSHVAKLMNAPIYIDDSPSLNVLELRAKARRLKAEHNIQLLIIDYLQLMEATKGENRQQEITHISRSIKGIAKELDIPVLALSQLSRAVESRDRSKRPQLSDLRESGAIEQDADVVMFVYRPEYYNIPEFDDGLSTHNMCELIIGKQRNGPTGNVRLTFLKEFGKFGDPDLFSEGGIYSTADF
ncbi:MAG TPA: replicative DNA helicase [Calditrichaeota bacterium]|nr:replicative DNA helicase [Calditrichota bacterium]